MIFINGTQASLGQPTEWQRQPTTVDSDLSKSEASGNALNAMHEEVDEVVDEVELVKWS